MNQSKNLMIKGCGLHHINVQVRDWNTSLQFYQDVLGMEIVAEFGPPNRKMALLNVGDGSHIELSEPATDTPTTRHPTSNDPICHIALGTTDAVAATERVRQAKCEITMAPKVIELNGSKVTISFFKGPNDEVIEFFQTH